MTGSETEYGFVPGRGEILLLGRGDGGDFS